MPRMNGVEFLTRLKAHHDTQSVPVIMLTALGKYNPVRESSQGGLRPDLGRI